MAYGGRSGQRHRPPQRRVVDQLRRRDIHRNFGQGGGPGGGLQHLPPAVARLGYPAAYNEALRVEDVGGVADAAGCKYWDGYL